MGNRRYALITAVVMFYCALAVAFLARLPIIERVGELLPHFVVALSPDCERVTSEAVTRAECHGSNIVNIESEVHPHCG